MPTTFVRRCQRMPFFCQATLTVLPEGTRIDAYCFDISMSGVGLNVQGSRPAGCMVRVSFHLRNSDGEVVEHVLGRIAYEKADESGTRVGIEFQESIRESTHPELTRRLQNL